MHGWQSAERNPSGKRSIVFRRDQALVDRPVVVPCGKCEGCRSDQALMWSVRAYHESLYHKQNSFLTLTYDDAHLPKDGKIVKRDLQLFFKRLRKSADFRYIACGEYGEHTHRPHYHALIFGQDFLGGSFRVNDQLYSHPRLVSVWGKGLVSCAEVTLASVMYVCGYTQKKIADKDTFLLSSRRPGIGAKWLEDYQDDVRRGNSAVTVDGRSFVLPLYYLNRLPEDFSAEIKRQKKEYALAHPRTLEQLDAKQLNMRAKLKQKKETL